MGVPFIIRSIWQIWGLCMICLPMIARTETDKLLINDKYQKTTISYLPAYLFLKDTFRKDTSELVSKVSFPAPESETLPKNFPVKHLQNSIWRKKKLKQQRTQYTSEIKRKDSFVSFKNKVSLPYVDSQFSKQVTVSPAFKNESFPNSFYAKTAWSFVPAQEPKPFKGLWQKIKKAWKAFKEWWIKFKRTKLKRMRLPTWGAFRWWARRKWREFRIWARNRRSKYTVIGLYIAFGGILLLLCSLIALMLTPGASLIFLILGLSGLVGGLIMFFINLYTFEGRKSKKQKRIPLHKY